jgi:hypothetical protein
MSTEIIRQYQDLWSQAISIKIEEGFTDNRTYFNFFKVLFLAISAFFQEIWQHRVIHAHLEIPSRDTASRVEWLSARIFDLLSEDFTTKEAAELLAIEAGHETQAGQKSDNTYLLNNLVGTEYAPKSSEISKEIDLARPIAEIPKLKMRLKKLKEKHKKLHGKSSSVASAKKRALKNEMKEVCSHINRHIEDLERNRSEIGLISFDLDHPRLADFPHKEALIAAFDSSSISMHKVLSHPDLAIQKMAIKAYSTLDPIRDLESLKKGMIAFEKAQEKESKKEIKLFERLTFDCIKQLEKEGLGKEAVNALRDYLVNFTVNQLAADFSRRDITFTIGDFEAGTADVLSKCHTRKKQKAFEIYKVLHAQLKKDHPSKCEADIQLMACAIITTTVQTYDAIAHENRLKLFTKTTEKLTPIREMGRPCILGSGSDLRAKDTICVKYAKEGCLITQDKKRHLNLESPILNPWVSYKTTIHEETTITPDLIAHEEANLVIFNPIPIIYPS